MKATEGCEKHSTVVVWRQDGGKEWGLKGGEPEPKEIEKYVFIDAPTSWGPAIVRRYIADKGYEEIHTPGTEEKRARMAGSSQGRSVR